MRSSFHTKKYLIPKIKAGRWLGSLAFLLLGILVYIVPVLPISVSSGQQNPKTESARLSAADKEELTEALRLKAEIGEEVWPGLGSADIPLILYDESFEFLVGGVNPPPPWQVVEGDDFAGRPYFRRAAQKSQSFAVAVGGQWAGSIGSFELMSRRIPLKLGRDFHVALILHEVFHAFQATRAQGRFAEAMAVYRSESRYLFKDAEFSAAWNSEGQALAEALKADEPDAVSSLVRKFVDIRDARRQRAALGPDHVSFERELEWLEGLAKYAEVRFYELAAARALDPAHAKYRPGLPYWQWDFARLRTNLGQQSGDLRFYLSGLAEARLLDRLNPGWKSKAMEKGAFLEDILRTAIVH